MWLRRPLLVAFILGCTVSLMTSGRLTLRLVAAGTIYGSFVPLVEIAGLAVAWWSARRIVSLPRAIDLFFAGHGPWLLWLTGIAAIWAFVPPARAFAWTAAPRVWLWYGSAIAVAIWSGVIDFRFFRRVLKRSRAGAGRDLVWQRLISWSVGLACFLGPAGWQLLATRLGI